MSKKTLPKKRSVEERLKRVEEYLANAEQYVAQDVNVEGSSWLHFGDWKGKSGHPSWMRNFAIPTMRKYRARKERALENVQKKAKDRTVTRRKCQGRQLNDQAK
jgi:hypothetical protein